MARGVSKMQDEGRQSAKVETSRAGDRARARVRASETVRKQEGLGG
jgi:hypothetical protein